MKRHALGRASHLRTVAALLGLLLLALLALTGCSGEETTDVTPRPVPVISPTDTTTPTVHPSASGAPTQRPNIVLVLMDDFSVDLIPSLGVGAEMAERGASYPHAFVPDSLCCVSRAALLTGQYPHQNGVRANSSQVSDARGKLGGWSAFEAEGNLDRSVNVALQKSGYRTGFVGKYLNEYEYNPGWSIPPAPPGWSQFNVLYGSAYDGWGFDSSYIEDGQTKVEHHATPSASASKADKDAAYAGQVIEDKALDFIRQSKKTDAPYFLKVAPFATHAEVAGHGAWPGEPHFPAAFADRAPNGRSNAPGGNCGPTRCRDVVATDLPGFGDSATDNRPVRRNGTPARAWNVAMPTASPAHWNAMRRDRARMAQSVDRTVRKILASVDENTYVLLTSDNGMHLGQLGLHEGKGTAYDTDVRVPLWVIGPGVAPGTRAEWTSNIDLAPTFEEMAGLQPADYRAGRSLLPSLADATSRTRTHVFFEHTNEPSTAGDPDRVAGGFEIDRIPSYVAVRGDEGLLVRYDLDPAGRKTQHGFEYYSYDTVPWEQTNQFTDPAHADRVAALRQQLRHFDQCRRDRRDDPVQESCRT